MKYLFLFLLFASVSACSPIANLAKSIGRATSTVSTAAAPIVQKAIMIGAL